MEKDPRENPYPYVLPDGQVILDEQCSCGHTRQNHGPRYAFGHGACLWETCVCPQFAFTERIMAPPKRKRRR